MHDAWALIFGIQLTLQGTLLNYDYLFSTLNIMTIVNILQSTYGF